MSEQDTSQESIRQAASESVASGEGIRERVRELTLRALQERRLDLHGTREVMRAMTEGISLGAQKRGSDMREALSEAFAGMDQAVSKAAQASSLALQEMSSRGREFTDTELRQGLERMRAMESSLVDSLRDISRSTGGAVKTEWEHLSSHVQNAGTDTGRLVSRTVRDFSARMTNAMGEGAVAGMEAARVFGERFAAMASGILAGMSEALRKDRDDKS